MPHRPCGNFLTSATDKMGATRARCAALTGKSPLCGKKLYKYPLSAAFFECTVVKENFACNISTPISTPTIVGDELMKKSRLIFYKTAIRSSIL